MPRTAAQYPSTTSPTSSSTSASPASLKPVASRAPSGRRPPRSLAAQGSGGAAIGGRRYVGGMGVWPIGRLGPLGLGRGLRCGGGATRFQNPTFDGAQPPHFAAHRDLRTTIPLEHWLGQVTHKVVSAVAVRS